MKWTVITLSSLALAACAPGVAGVPASPTVAQSAGQCFSASSVRGFETLRGGLVLVRAGGNRTFALQTLGNCPDLNWARGIGVRTFGGSSWICSGLDAQLIVPSPIGAQYCAVRDVRWISRDEARALRLASRR